MFLPCEIGISLPWQRIVYPHPSATAACFRVRARSIPCVGLSVRCCEHLRQVVKLDCDNHQFLMNKYRVRGLPFTALFNEGKVCSTSYVRSTQTHRPRKKETLVSINGTPKNDSAILCDPPILPSNAVLASFPTGDCTSRRASRHGGTTGILEQGPGLRRVTHGKRREAR